MNAAQVATRFLNLVDDPGVVNRAPAYVASLLETAFEELHTYYPTEFLEVSHTPPSLAGVFSIDLNGVLFGPQAAAWTILTAYAVGATVQNGGNVYRATIAGTSAGAGGPTGTGSAIVDGTVTWAFVGIAATVRAQRPTRVMQVDPTTGALLNVFEPASSFENLGQIAGVGSTLASNAIYGSRWFLDGRVMRFSRQITGTLQIWYTPMQSVVWLSAMQPGANVYLDDLAQFHDIIALFAAREYCIKTGKRNAPLEQQIANRVEKLELFFAQTRSGKGSQYVTDERW